MSAISWSGIETFTTPTASLSTASSGDDWIRSFQSSVALGLFPSYFWAGSGLLGASADSAGVSNFGTARCARAGNSAVTGGYGDGFLLLNQNHVSLHHIGSSWTGLLGHSSAFDHSTGSTGPNPVYWKLQSGVFSLRSSVDSHSGSTFIPFPVPYGGSPGNIVIRCLPNTLSYAVSPAIGPASGGNSGFTSYYSGLVPAESDTSVFWQSVGT